MLPSGRVQGIELFTGCSVPTSNYEAQGPVLRYSARHGQPSLPLKQLWLFVLLREELGEKAPSFVSV